MGCCGKIKRVKSIVKGLGKYVIEKKVGIILAGAETVNIRIAECGQCKKQTWFTTQEYVNYLLKNAGMIMRGLERLEEFPELEKKEKRENTNLYCMICKCFIKGKIRVENEKCPLDKW